MWFFSFPQGAPEVFSLRHKAHFKALRQEEPPEAKAISAQKSKKNTHTHIYVNIETEIEMQTEFQNTTNRHSPEQEELITRIVSRSNGSQLNRDEYSAIADCIVNWNNNNLRSGVTTNPQFCRFVSFSTGFDVPLWLDVNKNGVNLFLEHDPYYVELTKRENPQANVLLVKYETKMVADTTKHQEYFLRPQPIEGFLQEYRDLHWDIAFVDGPPGFELGCPGRFQSIFEASQLQGVKHVFIHDCNRTVEQECCSHFFNEKTGKWKLHETIRKLRHYISL